MRNPVYSSYKRVITLLNNVYLTASYITYIHAHCDRACARTQLPIPHIQFRMIITATWKKTTSIMISKSYRKFTTFHMGDYSVFFMEDFLSNKDSSDEIIGQSPCGEHCEFCDIRFTVIDFTQVQRLQDYRRVRISSQTANTPILRLRRMCPTVYSVAGHVWLLCPRNFKT